MTGNERSIQSREGPLPVLLSIAIPTYNGVSTIREALQSVATQVEPGVDILVMDNASTDETQSVVQEFQQEMPSLRYLCNEYNVGPDRNFDLAVRKAHGQYVWLLSDDDKLAAGAIKRVLSVLRKNQDLALVFANWATYSADFSQCLSPRALEISDDFLCHTADEFLLKTGELASFVSCCIVRRDLWNRVDSAPYTGSNWLQYAARLALLREHSAYCVAEPIVLYRGETTRWESEGTLLRYKAKLGHMITERPKLGYDEVVVRRTLRGVVHRLPLTVFTAKVTGLSLNSALVRTLTKTYGSYVSFWIVVLPLLLLPCWTHRLIWGVYRIPVITKSYRSLKSSLMRAVSIARSPSL